MESGIEIRKFGWDDLEQYTYLFNEINGLTDSEKAFDVEFMRQFLSQPSCDPEEHCYLAQLDGLIVGSVLVAYEEPIGRAVASGGVLKSHRSQTVFVRIACALHENVIFSATQCTARAEKERQA